MRTPLFLAAISSVLLVAGCDFLKKKGDVDASADATADVDAAPAAAAEDAASAPAPVVVNAKNMADVARFPGETPAVDDDAKLAQLTSARSAPKGGNVVAAVKPGSDVVKVAEYQGSFLVTFADPKDAASTLMGWIPKEAFSAPLYVARDGGAKLDASAPVVDAGPPTKLTCPPAHVAVVLSTTPVCKKRCTKDADCKRPTSAGACANATTVAGSVARVCAAD